MSNTIVVTGNLGADPEQRSPGAGPVELRLADNTGYGDRKRTTWWRVTVWGKTGEYAMRSLVKGDLVTVAGEASADEWQGRDGTKRVTLELNAQRLDGPFQRRKLDAPGGEARESYARAPAHAQRADDDIPF